MTKQDIVKELYVMRDHKDKLLYDLHDITNTIAFYEEMLDKMKQLEVE